MESMGQELMQGTPFWPYPRIVAHRLCGTLAPENTLAALERAHGYGVLAVETDAMLTQDGILLLSHDETLGRAIAGTENVADCTWDQLKERDAGSWFSAQYSQEKPALLRQALSRSAALGLWMNLEIKPTAQAQVETARAVIAQLRRVAPLFSLQGSPAFPLLSSFSVESLQTVAQEAPDMPRGLLLETIPAHWEQLAQQLGVRTIHPDASSVTPEFVLRAHALGLGVMCYTVDSREEFEKLKGWGVDAVCTNRPDLLGVSV